MQFKNREEMQSVLDRKREIRDVMSLANHPGFKVMIKHLKADNEITESDLIRADDKEQILLRYQNWKVEKEIISYFENIENIYSNIYEQEFNIRPETDMD